MTKIQLKRSSALQSSTVSRAPTSSQLDYGELAINYNSADPQLFIKDSSGSVLRLLDYYAKVSGTTFTGDVNFDGELTIQGDSTNGSGQLTLTCEQNTHAVKIKAPAHSAAANYTLTLPSNAGSNSNVLTTDGSGNLSWALSSMTTADKNKLDGIESGATADQTGAEIKSLYEGESNTNAFTDAEKVKLSGIAAGAEVNVGTDLSYTATSRLLSSSTGSNVNLPEATPSQPGLLSAADKTKLNAIETSATADQTAAEILTAIKTVDGSGSGLDADTVDGLQASSFLRSDADDDFSGTLRGNNTGGTYFHLRGGASTNTLLFRVSAADNNENIASNLSSDFGFNIRYRGDLGGNENALQIDADNQSGASIEALRIKQDGVVHFGPTPKVGTSVIWHAGNDGAGSGLDADLLDGINSGSFLRSDQEDQATKINIGGEISASSSAKFQVYGFSRLGPIMLAVGTASSNSFNTSNERWIMNNGSHVYLSTSSSSYNNKIWTDSNDGSGSGLDADLLDGVQGSSYLRSDTNDTFTGVLDINGTVTVDCGNTTTGLSVRASSGSGNSGRINLGFGNGGNNPKIQLDDVNNDMFWGIGAHDSPNNLYIWGKAGSSLPSFESHTGGTSSNIQFEFTTGGNFKANGSITAGGNVTAYSDINIKTNVELISNALEKVLDIRGVTFNRTDVDCDRQSGVIAQDVEKVLPEVVQENDQGIKTVAYGNMIGLVIEAIKELKITVDALSHKIDKIESV